MAAGKGKSYLNFVLACPECNLKKKIIRFLIIFLYKICKRNTEMITINRKNINQDFQDTK